MNTLRSQHKGETLLTLLHHVDWCFGWFANIIRQSCKLCEQIHGMIVKEVFPLDMSNCHDIADIKTSDA
jgi:hypothetical protein